MPPIAAQILVYLGAVVWRVRNLRPHLQQRFSSVEHRQLLWLEAGAFTLAALVLAWVATWPLPVAVSNILTNGLLAADLAILGIFGARQKNVFGSHPWIGETADLAEHVGATPHQLSQVLSVHVGLNFFEYVNGQRVEAAKATLVRPQSVGRPLLEIALECGFGSKFAFNDAFKRATGMSPSAFRKGLPGVIGARGHPV